MYFLEHLHKVALGGISQILRNLYRGFLRDRQQPLGLIHLNGGDKGVDRHAGLPDKALTQVGTVHAQGFRQNRGSDGLAEVGQDVLLGASDEHGAARAAANILHAAGKLQHHTGIQPGQSLQVIQELDLLYEIVTEGKGRFRVQPAPDSGPGNQSRRADDQVLLLPQGAVGHAPRWTAAAPPAPGCCA